MHQPPEVSSAGSTRIIRTAVVFDYCVHWFPDTLITASILSVFPWSSSSSLRVLTISVPKGVQSLEELQPGVEEKGPTDEGGTLLGHLN